MLGHLILTHYIAVAAFCITSKYHGDSKGKHYQHNTMSTTGHCQKQTGRMAKGSQGGMEIKGNFSSPANLLPQFWEKKMLNYLKNANCISFNKMPKQCSRRFMLMFLYME